MKTPHIELTPEQKALLASLSQETGKSPMALIEEALERLREHVCPINGNTHSNHTENAELLQSSPVQSRKSIWELFEEASHNIPDEELDRLPTDGSYQHDHYIYGTKKRPT